MLDLLDDCAGEADQRRLEARREREADADAYFDQIAPSWDRIRSHHVRESAAEAPS